MPAVNLIRGVPTRPFVRQVLEFIRLRELLDALEEDPFDLCVPTEEVWREVEALTAAARREARAAEEPLFQLFEEDRRGGGNLPFDAEAD